MKVAIVYLNVIGRSDPNAPDPEHYRPWIKRFTDSYKKFFPTIPHQLHVVHCGGPADNKSLSEFEGLSVLHFSYTGGGWDIGAHQSIVRNLVGTDFVICAATPIYFWKSGFVEAMVAAREKFGDGLYGPTASYEWNPHIRTCCWAFDPRTFIRYPHIIDTRQKTFRAESGDLSITAWYEAQGKPRIMVACDGCYAQSDWRKPSNIFRRGDQSNCFVRDRHTDLWDDSSPERKQELSDWADGKLNNP